MHYYTAVVSKETEQSHDEESSLQGSIPHRAFWEKAGTREQFIRSKHTSALRQRVHQAVKCSQ